MLLYFDYNGKLKAQIEHGYPPRQGSDLPITICLPLDFWTYNERDENDYTKTISFRLGDTLTSEIEFDNRLGELYTFTKLNKCEITSAFVEGKSYLCYKTKIFGTDDIVKNAGEIFAIIKFYHSDSSVEPPIITDCFVNGVVSIFLERTYGNASKRIASDLLIKYDDIIARIAATEGNIPKNIKDQGNNIVGALKQVGSGQETSFTNELNLHVYETGAFGQFSFEQGGLNHVGQYATGSFVGGNKSVVRTKYSFNFSDNSIIDGISLHFNNVILGGSQNYMNDAKNSVILGGESNKIDGTSQGYLRANDLIFGTNNVIETSNAIALGSFLYVNQQYQMAVGKYNATDSSALFLVGNGRENSNRKNAFSVKTDGSAELQTQGSAPNSVVIKSEHDKKLDRRDEANLGNRLYGVLNNGEQTMYVVQQAPYSNTIAQRDSNGRVRTAAPDSDYDATTKLYVDGKFSDAKNYTDSAATDSLTQANNYTDQQIQELKDNPDVVDIVATYADLLSYDTTALGNKDIIRVLSDESQQGGGKSTYYKWNYPNAGWNFVGMLTGEAGTTVYVNNVSQPTWNADTKLDKKTYSTADRTRLYAVNGSQQVMMGVVQTPEDGAIPQYSANDTLKTSAPIANNDSTNKEYVDSGLSGKLDKSTTTKNYDQVYTRTSGKNGATVLQETKALTYENIVGGGTVPIRNANNNIQVGTASNDNDAVNKAYVDGMFIKVFTTTSMQTSTLPSIAVPALTAQQIGSVQTAISQGKRVVVDYTSGNVTQQFVVTESDHDGDVGGIRFTYYNYYLDYTLDGAQVTATYSVIGGGGEIEVIGYGR